MKKHVVAAQARNKLNHAVGTIGKVSLLMRDAKLNSASAQDGDDDVADDDDDDDEEDEDVFGEGDKLARFFVEQRIFFRITSKPLFFLDS